MRPRDRRHLFACNPSEPPVMQGALCLLNLYSFSLSFSFSSNPWERKIKTKKKEKDQAAQPFISGD